MKILITGATGFVGSCLTRRLVDMKNKERGHTSEQGKGTHLLWRNVPNCGMSTIVECPQLWNVLNCGMSPIDIHIFTRSQSNKWRIADLMEHVTNHEVDLRDAGTVEKAVSQICPRVIYHLATYGGFASQKDTTAIIESNFMGTINLLRACEKIGFDYFINTGSSSEYGIKTNPMHESDSLEPLGDYGVSKAAAALFCRSRALERGLPVVTLRLFSPYGPWDDHQRLIPYVIKSLLRGESPQLSTPKSVRDFIFIDDVLDAYLNAITVSLPKGAIINVGSGMQYSIGEVVDMITKIIGNGSGPMWGQASSQRPEPDSWVADISKAKTELQWLPFTSLWAGLDRTVQWFKDNLELYP